MTDPDNSTLPAEGFLPTPSYNEHLEKLLTYFKAHIHKVGVSIISGNYSSVCTLETTKTLYRRD